MKKPVKPVSAGPPAKKPRGRPRSIAARAAILRAASALLAESGPGAVSMEAVAARAGVGKPTVYRWWPDRHAVLMAALMESEAEAARPRPARSALRALGRQLATIAERFNAPSGRHIATMIAAADPNTELAKAFRNHFVLARRAEGRLLLEEAITAGELRNNLDVEVALDLLYGPLFFRLLIGHGPLNAAFTQDILQHALSGLQVR
jgi:AcrR family transcriptional regulator